MTIHPISLESTIKDKVAWARDCMDAFGDVLTGDGVIVSLCRELGSAIRDSHAAMIRLGIVEECRECEDVRGGSCCGLGLENYYSGNLLLINLLLGIDLPGERVDPRGCFFLGEMGCRLAVRDVICINYLCEEITSRFSAEGIADLREKEGKEVGLLFRLNERILAVLAEQEDLLTRERHARA
ncbi:MAG: hypothetical protein C4576_18570 [Desulfobacteraceae bacterium]|nr:MAG: hypothetical protein C4576_18570 [Desulfobacteraceae bacterium]